MGRGAQSFEGTIVEGHLGGFLARFGLIAQGARIAEARGAGFPLHQVMELSIA